MESTDQSAVTVLEDGLDATADGADVDLSTGNRESGETATDDEADESSSGGEKLDALFSVGADEDLSFSLDTDTSGLPTLYSGGVALVYAVSEGADDWTLTATKGTDTIFTLTIHKTSGDWDFDLDGQLDHVAPGAGFAVENLDLVSGDGSASVSAIDFSSIILGTDFDGDTISLGAGDFTVAVVDDVPVEIDDPVTATVDEDALGRDTGDLGDTDDPDDLSLGNEDASRTGEVTVDPSVDAVSGSLSSLVSVGADEEVSFSLNSSTGSLASQGLTSKGAALIYDVSGDTLTASVISVTGNLALGTADDAGLGVISVDGAGNINATGMTVGDLVDAIDALGGVTAFLDASGFLVIESEDGTDFNVAGLSELSGITDLTYDDDDTRTVFTLTVETDGDYEFDLEDQIDQAAPTAAVEGSADLGNPDDDLDLNTNAGGTLTINGKDIALSGDVSANQVVTAINDKTGDTGVTAALMGGMLVLTATAESEPIAIGGNADVLIDLGLTAGTFDAAEENDLVINFSEMILASDADGDTITLSGDAFTITVVDDIPWISVTNLVGSGTVDPQFGYWASMDGADEIASLVVTLDGYEIHDNGAGDPTNITFEMTGSFNGDYFFTGTITDDFDGNPITTDSITFDLTLRADGTYVFDLLGGFGSSIEFSTADDGSLDAGGPDAVRTLDFDDPDNGKIVFIAVKTGASQDQIKDLIGFNENEPRENDPSETDIEDDLAFFTGVDLDAKLNVSTSGIGIKNNNLDSGERILINPTVLITTMTVFIDNSVQGYDNPPEELYYTIYYANGDVSAPTVSSSAKCNGFKRSVV